jgi:hypothetical protein
MIPKVIRLTFSRVVLLRGCGFFQVLDDKIAFQRGYWDKLSFLRLHGLPIPDQQHMADTCQAHGGANESSSDMNGGAECQTSVI